MTHRRMGRIDLTQDVPCADVLPDVCERLGHRDPASEGEDGEILEAFLRALRLRQQGRQDVGDIEGPFAVPDNEPQPRCMALPTPGMATVSASRCASSSAFDKDQYSMALSAPRG